MEEIKQEEGLTDLSSDEASSAPADFPQEKMSFRNKLILLALFGALIGFVIKTEAAKRLTIGFEDYKLPPAQETYDINQLERDLLKEKEALDQQRADEAGRVQSGNPEEAGNAQASTCQEGEVCKP